MNRQIKVAFVGSKVSLCRSLGREINYFDALDKQFSTISSRDIVLAHWDDSKVGMSDISALASNDIVILNWAKISLLIAIFLRQNKSFKTKLVLYSGVFLIPGNRALGFKMPIGAEIEDLYPKGQKEIDFSITKESIMEFGLFDFFISKENSDWSCHSWSDVIDSIGKEHIDRKLLVADKCFPYFAYRWLDYEFRDKGTHSYSTSYKSALPWYVNPLARNGCIERFQRHFVEDIMKDSDEIYAKPIWGLAEIDEEKLSNSCFVLMPFREPFNTIYEDHIREPLSELNIKCYRADDLYTTNSVMGDVWNGINNSKFLIAELSTKNPNVMYELGIAHTLGKKVIMICQDEDDVPFDFRHLRYYKYEHTPRGCSKLERHIFAAASEIIAKT